MEGERGRKIAKTRLHAHILHFVLNNICLSALSSLQIITRITSLMAPTYKFVSKYRICKIFRRNYILNVNHRIPGVIN